MKSVLPGPPVPGMVCERGVAAAIAREDAEAGFWEAPSSPARSPCKIQDGSSSHGAPASIAQSDAEAGFSEAPSSPVQSPCRTQGSDFWSRQSSPVKERPAGWGLPHAADHPIFLDADAMKEKVRQALHKPTYNVANFYKETGVWQEIARSSKFENVVLSVISINALWIAIDTEWNDSKVLNTAHLIFQFAEHFFCAFFFLEWLVRFMAFKVKRDGLKDAWFLFDSVMMCMMVLETWVMSFYIYTTGSSTAIAGGNSSALRLLRILRLSRVARVAKLLRALPDLMILLKGLLAAVRSVFFTFCLLLLIIYVFAIAIKQLAAETHMGSKYFSGVATSMYTLFVRGALLDEVSKLLNDAFSESPLVGTLLIFFILAASVTVMNMLIGVLCQVVTTVAEVEKEEMTVVVFEGKLRAVAARLDHDKDGTISKEEFCSLLGDSAACKALQDVGVDAVGLIDYADIIFEAEEGRYDKTLSFGEFIEIVLDLRGSSPATVKDIVDLRKYTRNVLKRTTVRMDECNSRLARIEEGMSRLLGADSPCKREGHGTSSRSLRRSSSRSQSLRRSSSVTSFSRSPDDHHEVKRISVLTRQASSSDVANEVDLTSPATSLQSPRFADAWVSSTCESCKNESADLVRSHGPPAEVSSTCESCKNESADLVRLMEKLDHTLNARMSDLHRLIGDMAQDMCSGVSAPEPFLASPQPPPRAAQVADASSSCASSHANPARSLPATLRPEDTKRDSHSVGSPREAVRVSPFICDSP